METTTKPDGTKVETTTAKDGSTSKTTTNPNGSSVTENKAADGSTGTVKIVDNSKDFIDTREHWSRDQVNFVAARELFQGVGNNQFGVGHPMTRGMVNTVLARLAGVDTTPLPGRTGMIRAFACPSCGISPWRRHWRDGPPSPSTVIHL